MEEANSFVDLCCEPVGERIRLLQTSFSVRKESNDAIFIDLFRDDLRHGLLHHCLWLHGAEEQAYGI